jgi:tetratricopeptide (TPR) repeat protein
MAKRLRERLAEWALVLFSIGLTCLCIEAGYRIYLFYNYAVVANYSIVTMDARQPRLDLNAPGNVFGPNPISTLYNKVYYNGKNEIVYRNGVRTNNLGWTSRYDYSPTKTPGEYRIAVLGGSTTAAATNEFAWTDAVQDRLNSDRELLTALGVKKFSVLNIGFVGAGMSTFAVPGAMIARRFSPDLTVINFSIDTLVLDGTKEFKAPPAEPETEVGNFNRDVKVSAERDFELVNGVEIQLSCHQGPVSLSNPNCVASPVWYVPPGQERSGAEIAEIKRTVARRRLLYTVLLSPRPLALLEILGHPVIPRAQAAESTLSAEQRAQLKTALSALQFIHQLQPHLLLTHNPHIWHTQPPLPLQIDELMAQLKADGFDIARMSEHMPARLDSREARNWYMFDGHWSDKGAAIYGDAVARVIRQRLLAERGLGRSGDEAACASSFAQFQSARAALAKGEQPVAEKELDAALAGLPAEATDQGRPASSDYADCGFVTDLHLERAALFEAQGDGALAEAHWQAALRTGDPASLYERRAALRLAAGNDRGASDDFSEVIRLKPEEPQLYVARGDLRLKAQDGAGALDDFKSASKLGEIDVTLRFRLSQAQFLLQDYAGVVSNTTAGLGLLPGNAGLLFLRGSAREKLGHFDDALADYSAAIAQGPNASISAVRAQLLQRLGGKPDAK